MSAYAMAEAARNTLPSDDFGLECQRVGCDHYRAQHLNGACDWPGIVQPPCQCPGFLHPDHDDDPEERR